MSKIFAISDTWFNRPFGDNGESNVDEYNKNIIEIWNKNINKNDDVYVLGGFGISDLYHIVIQLNGKIHFLNNYYNEDEISSINDLKVNIFNSANKKLSSKIFFETNQIITLTDNDAVLSYLPLSYWYGKDSGIMCFHGLDEKSNLNEFKINCSALCNNFVPINILDAMNVINTTKYNVN